MFISGCGSKYNSKKIITYLFISILFIMSASISIMSKSALAEDIGKKIENGTASCKDASKGAGGKSWRETRTLQGNQGWWWCESSSGERYRLDEILCAAGYDIEEKSEDYRSHPYRKTRCIKKTENSNKTSTIDKRAIALANTARQSRLEGVILPKITDTPWFKTLSDKDKLDSGCVDSGGGKITCDEHAKNNLTKGLVGTCIASARTTVANRPDGQDKSNEQMDKAFTDCITGNSGLDEGTVNNNKTPIAWNDIDSYIKEEDKKEAEAAEKSKADEAKNSCGIGGMGWLICPLMTFMGGIADASYSVISQFLNINPAVFGEGSDAVGAKQAWNFFRDIANVIFVLLFLWVIFSQVSSIGISNYGIKKVLPKLIVGAVLVNLSFYICQLAVDLSNILGFTLKEALEGAVSGVGGSSSNSAIVSGLGTAVAGILVLTGTVLFAALAVSIPTLLSLMLVLLVVLVILIVRQAAIVLLISIAPLAFAAWLLPNTESLFKKWVSMFRGLLMVFPIISLLYGAGKLAGAILMTTATSDPNDTAITMQFAGLAASILPLGATPFVIKSSLNSLGSIGAKIGGLSSVATGSLKNSVMNKSRISDAKNAWKSRSAKKLAERRSGNTKWGRTASNLRGSSSWLKKGVGVAMNPAAALDNSWVGQKIGLSSGAGAAQEAYDKSAMEKAERAITYQYSGDAEAALKDKKADKYTRIAAVNQLKGQGAHGADVVANYLRNGGEVDSVSMANALTEMKGSHAGVAQVGVNALNALQSGQSNFSLGAKDKSGKFIPGSADTPFNTLTSQGVSKLSNEAIAKQNADAINRSSLSNSQASEILGDDRLVSIMSQDTRKALESI